MTLIDSCWSTNHTMDKVITWKSFDQSFISNVTLSREQTLDKKQINAPQTTTVHRGKRSDMQYIYSPFGGALPFGDKIQAGAEEDKSLKKGSGICERLKMLLNINCSPSVVVGDRLPSDCSPPPFPASMPALHCANIKPSEPAKVVEEMITRRIK